MMLRAVIILALLTQQVAVWPCLSICRMTGGCVSEECVAGVCDASSDVCCGADETSACCDEAAGSELECETSCAAACNEPVRCECGIIGHLACASAAAQTTEQGQPTGPAAQAVDLFTLLALPAHFVEAGNESRIHALAPSVEWAWRSTWAAIHPRSMLCCWLI